MADKMSKLEKTDRFQKAVKAALEKFGDTRLFPNQHSADLTTLIRIKMDKQGLELKAKKGWRN